MKKQLAITDINKKHRVTEKLFITDEAQKQRKIKKLFRTVNGIFQLIYSSGVIWEKYNCSTIEVPTSYTQVSSSGKWSIGDTQTTIYSSLSYYTGYYFSSSDGFVGTGYDTADSWEELPSSFYLLSNEIVWKMLSCTPIEDWTSASVEVTWECVGLCEAETETVYEQGSTLYGTIEAEEGALPEDGTLIEGSIEDGYYVLEISGTYFYYVLQES
jgi:hypothetical protein